MIVIEIKQKSLKQFFILLIVLTNKYRLEKSLIYKGFTNIFKLYKTQHKKKYLSISGYTKIDDIAHSMQYFLLGEKTSSGEKQILNEENRVL